MHFPTPHIHRIQKIKIKLSISELLSPIRRHLYKVDTIICNKIILMHFLNSQNALLPNNYSYSF